MCDRGHRILCVRDRPILRLYNTSKKTVYLCAFGRPKRGCKEHVKGYKYPRISILYAIIISVKIGSIWEVFHIGNCHMS